MFLKEGLVGDCCVREILLFVVRNRRNRRTPRVQNAELLTVKPDVTNH